MEIYKPGDIVWVHDYQLLLVPEIIRQRAGAAIYIGLFLHTPFPSSEIIRCLSSKFACFLLSINCSIYWGVGGGDDVGVR